MEKLFIKKESIKKIKVFYKKQVKDISYKPELKILGCIIRDDYFYYTFSSGFLLSGVIKHEIHKYEYKEGNKLYYKPYIAFQFNDNSTHSIYFDNISNCDIWISNFIVKNELNNELILIDNNLY